MTGAKAKNRRPGAAVPYILAACTAVSVLSTDLITPSIPDLPEALGTDIRAAQLTVSVNLLAYALAQLVHGPVADAIGRRRLLIVAFIAFAAASIFSALSVSIGGLLTGRFLQGLLSSVPSVVIVLMIREFYSPQKALKVMALYGAALGVAPALGPLTGGYLHVWFGWQAGFWFIAVLALAVMLAVVRYVPESLAAPRPLRLRNVLGAYLTLLGNIPFLARSIGVSGLFSAYFAYVTSAPVVFIEILGLPNQRYGLTHVLIIAAYIIGNVTASRLSGRYESATLLRGGALGMMLAVAIFAIPVFAGVLLLPLLLLAMTVYAFNLAFVLAAGPLVVLDTLRDGGPQGPAAALLGSFQLGFSALAGYVAASLYNGTATGLAAVMTVCVLTGALFIIRSR